MATIDQSMSECDLRLLLMCVIQIHRIALTKQLAQSELSPNMC